jgi:DNA polymerase I-like protein with 3'-5' exonuclease and polymerase domains
MKGLFWEDDGKRHRAMAPIPKTGWRAPTSYPNLSTASVLSIDVETYDPQLDAHGPGWSRGSGYLVGFSVGAPGGKWYFPIRHTVSPEENLPPEHALSWLRDTLSNAAQPKVGANLLYDIGWLRSEGVNVAGELVDVQFAEALLDEASSVGLDVLAQKYLGVGKTTSQLYDWCSASYGEAATDRQRKNIYRAPPSLVGPYGESDAELPLLIAPIQYAKLVDEGLLDLFRLECALIPLLVEMRYQGVRVDLDKAETIRKSLTDKAELRYKELRELVGFDLNVNSADSVGRAFTKAGLSFPTTATGAASFVKEFLKTVNHPIAEHILEIRRCEKLCSTFIEGYIINGSVDGKIHASFHPLRSDGGGTRSGRFSSSCPNLQNLPIRDPELGKEIRSIFVPDVGHAAWRKYDYSQIEFRLLVHFAVGKGSDEARALYVNDPNTDYHKMVQGLVEAATGKQWDRRPIKNINFGKVYGMGVKKAGKSTGLKGEALTQLLDAYDEGIPFAKTTLKWASDIVEHTGVMPTILGRKSRFDLWTSEKYDPDAKALAYDDALHQYGRIKRAGLHKALNRLLQGSAADLLKVAMLRCWNEGIFAKTGVPRLTVHDELDFSDPGGVDEDYEKMKHVMETALPLRVPVVSDFEIGPNWGYVM